MAPTNPQMAAHTFLELLDGDSYFPPHLVAKGKAILVRLCERIEAERPATVAELTVLTTAATEEFNALNYELMDAGSEIETMARDEIAEDFARIADSYGFPDADIEALVANRDW